ncbi:hypothetical protein Dimus_023971 [Dionaea muscipula]
MASQADTTKTEEEAPTATDAMELEKPQSEPAADSDDQGSLKRERGEPELEGEGNGGDSKKQKLEEPAEEEEGLENNGDGEKSGTVNVGPKKFGSSVEMFDYFYGLLHRWPHDVNVNKYEYLVLLDLIKKGYPEPEKKISVGIDAFQIRHHPSWKSRCFFLIRTDGSVDDFSFRKCVDYILPLPENMKVKPDVNKALGGGGGRGGHGNRGGGWGKGGGGGGGRGRGKGGRSRK